MKRIPLLFFLTLLVLSGCAGLPDTYPDEQEQVDRTPAETAVLLSAETDQPIRAAPTDTDLPETPTEQPTRAPTSTFTPTQPPPGPTTAPPTPAGPGGGTSQEEITAAVTSDLADRLGISPSAVTVVRVTAKTWSDASLGCPEPEMMYAQVLTPGYQIILEAGGTHYDYRADQSGYFKLCRK